jgi:hypothetical protein
MARPDDPRETEAEDGPVLIGPDVERLVSRCLEQARHEDTEAEVVVARAGESKAANVALA